MVHEIHNSERRSFRGCRRRWNWAYIEGYVPIEPEDRLDFGIAFHCGMQVFYNPGTWDTTDADEKAAGAIQAFLLECEVQRKRYLETHKLNELPQEMESDFEDKLDLGTGMLNYHAKYVHPKYDKWFRPVAVEISFEVPLVDPDDPKQLLHCHNSPQCGQNHSNDPNDPDSLVVYAGRVDALCQDIVDGDYYIFDWKSAGVISKNEDFLELDDQVAGYTWALWERLNLNISGFIYAETRKDFPRPPRLLKRMQKGCHFSTSKVQPTNLEVFEPYVAQHDPQALLDGCYDDYLEFLRSSDTMIFSQRFTVLKGEEELVNVGKAIAQEAADMINEPRLYPNKSRFHCTSCKYRQPCIGMDREEDISYLLEGGFIQTNRRHWMEERRVEEQEVTE
jgi:hypothetical protein